jgi:hypothetical protein
MSVKPKKLPFPFTDGYPARRNLKKPPAARFCIADKATGEIIAVIEAEDALKAYARFDRVKAIIRKTFYTSEILSVKEQDPETPCHSAFFANGFFDMLDASDALKH